MDPCESFPGHEHCHCYWSSHTETVKWFREKQPGDGKFPEPCTITQRILSWSVSCHVPWGRCEKKTVCTTRHLYACSWFLLHRLAELSFHTNFQKSCLGDFSSRMSCQKMFWQLQLRIHNHIHNLHIHIHIHIPLQIFEIPVEGSVAHIWRRCKKRC